MPDGADNQEDRHATEQIRTALVVFFFGIEKFIADNRRNKQKPHKIGDNKIFAEWNFIINRHRYEMKIRGHCFLEPDEPWHIDCDVKQCPYMIIFFQKRRNFFIHAVWIPFLLCSIENRKDIQPVNSHAFLTATFQCGQMVVYHAFSECAIAAPINP